MQKTGFVKALDSNCRHSENASLAARCFKVFKMDSKETALLAAFGSPYYKPPNGSASEMRSTPR